MKRHQGFNIIEMIVTVAILLVLAGVISIAGESFNMGADVANANVAIETARNMGLNFISKNSQLTRGELVEIWEEKNKSDILKDMLREDRERMVIAYGYGNFWIGYHLKHLPTEVGYSKEWLQLFLGRNKSAYGSVHEDFSKSSGSGNNVPSGLLDNSFMRDMVNDKNTSYGNGIDVINYIWLKVL